MRILWIDPLNTNPHYLNLMAVVLRDAGHEVHVCSVAREGFPTPIGVCWVPFTRLAEPIFAFKNRLLTSATVVARYPFNWQRAIRYAHSCGVQAVVVSTNLTFRRTDAWAMRSLKRSGLSTVVVVHKPWQTFHLEKRAKASHRAFYGRADRVLTMDDHTRRLLRNVGTVAEERLRHLPFPHFEPILSAIQADQAMALRLANWATPTHGSPAPVIAFLSQMREEHGFDDLLAALPAINDQLAEWRLLVVSSSVSAQKSKAVEHRLHTQGFLDRCWLHWNPYSLADLKAFVDTASLVVTPYKWAGRSVVTAIAAGAGLPVVATDVGGLAVGIRSGVNGEVVAPSKPDELATAIVEVVRDLPRYRLGAREPDEDFAPRRAAETLASVLREVVE